MVEVRARRGTELARAWPMPRCDVLTRLELTDRFVRKTDPDFVSSVVAAALEFCGEPEREVSLLLTDDAEIARVHGEFLGDPTPTDVISFELDDTIDMVVSVECAERRARELGHDARAEVALYIVHGLLHGCGYDDHDDVDRARMRDAEREVLRRLALDVTPVDGSDDAC